MRIGSLVLASCFAAALLSPATASATVIFDSVLIESSTVASLNAQSLSQRRSYRFASIASVKGGDAQDTSSSQSKTAGSADATSSSSAILRSHGANGGFRFDQTADTTAAGKSRKVTSDASASGEVDYTFTLTGPRLYDLNVIGSAGGTASGEGAEGDFATTLLDDTTNKVVWDAVANPGDTFHHVVLDLPNGKYELLTEDLLEPSSASSGFKGSGSVTMTGTTDFSFAQVAAAVPEPGTWALMGLGLLFVGAMARRRRATAGAALA